MKWCVPEICGVEQTGRKEMMLGDIFWKYKFYLCLLVPVRQLSHQIQWGQSVDEVEPRIGVHRGYCLIVDHISIPGGFLVQHRSQIGYKNNGTSRWNRSISITTGNKITCTETECRQKKSEWVIESRPCNFLVHRTKCPLTRLSRSLTCKKSLFIQVLRTAVIKGVKPLAPNRSEVRIPHPASVAFGVDGRSMPADH